MPLRVVAPEMEAVPPTSNEVSVALPALIPNLESESISKLDDTDTPAEKSVNPVKALADVPDWV